MVQVASDGQMWNYEEIGSGEGTPLLILHGWGRSGNEWMQMARDLGAWSGRKVYILDLPGFGGSSLPKVDNIYEYTQLVENFCNYLSIAKVILIGHSLGGRVGIVLAEKHETIIEKLILIDPAGVKHKSLRRTILQLFSYAFRIVPTPFRRRISGIIMDEDYRNSPTLHNLYRAVVAEDLKKLLHKINCETIVVWGESDPILPITLTKIYKKFLKNCLVRVVWGAKHDPHLSHYGQTLAILQENIE